MRISTNPRDRGYRPGVWQFRVTLDGVRQEYAITADDDIGLVIRTKLNDYGTPMMHPAGNAFLQETCYGVVKINRAAERGFG